MLKSKRSSIERLLDSMQLEGLIPEPETSLLDDPWYMLIMLCVATAIAAWKIYHKRSAPAHLAKCKIKALLNAPKSTSQNTALELSNLLRQGLEVTRLEQYNPEKSEQWELFLHHINKACFEDKSLSDSALQKLFDQALSWLNNQ